MCYFDAENRNINSLNSDNAVGTNRVDGGESVLGEVDQIHQLIQHLRVSLSSEAVVL